ncbi:Hormonally up-regulated neu tumor-associated kinase [Liparis tanakae]|uniref:Hormonally up-regulated neu tumor-associated kinase n=1 Tax=Liparis tanakae TaxID=230148 RepID=A0A4Z2HIQ6_9TELE|nr:Hormonally up-regulated neu tumor-associated kinase [Liparis tanakae]
MKRSKEEEPDAVCVVGAVAFVLSLLEPDPTKRPSVRAALEERWINEGHREGHAQRASTPAPQNR